MEDIAEQKSQRLSRRDFLKMAGVGTGAFVIGNSLLGERIEDSNFEIPKSPDILSDYAISWESRPWVWINLAIASELIDGTVIKPGEEVSLIKLLKLDETENLPFNNTNPSEGYIAAQMMNPANISGIGYGLCLGSTSIFRAVLESPLLVKERNTHFDIYPEYFKDMPIGTDSSIYYSNDENDVPSIDLILFNPTDKDLILEFKVFDSNGEILKPPDKNVSQLWYKNKYLDLITKILSQKIEKETGIDFPKQYFPEYTFGGKKITVYTGVKGVNVDYSVNLGPVKHGDSTVVDGVEQYRFSRYLTVGGSNYTENYISNYR